MREILFRGKRIDNGEWVEGGLFVQNEDDVVEFAAYILTPSLDYICNAYLVDPDTVGQYTGKVVKTGKVFDGDIGKSIDGIFLVCWDDEKAAFVMRFNEYPYETLYLEEMWDDAEIIGNIHDNPELMEVRRWNG